LPADPGVGGRVVTCKERACALVEIVPAELLPAKLDPASPSPAVVWTERFTAAGSVLTTPRDARVDVYGVVLRGAVKVRGVEAAKGDELGPWKAFRAPGGAVAVTSTKPDTLVMLAVVSDGNASVAALARTHDRASTWKERPHPLETRDLAASADLAWMGGAFHARIGFDGPGQRASLGVLLAGPDAKVLPHVHDTSWEILVALRAKGSFGLDDGSGALVAAPLADAGVVMVPRGARHSWTPAGDSPLVAIQLYSPPGPEQRFRDLAQKPH
jgi:mannose-6-phosphate isomerase-like protein (cupin superfamily)